jgi:competence protein ComGC
MKKFIEIGKKKRNAFTLLEMLVVIFIIAILMLLFVPKLADHKASSQKQADAALVETVEQQQELFTLDEKNDGIDATPENLKTAGYLTEKQLNRYNKIQDEKE